MRYPRLRDAVENFLYFDEMSMRASEVNRKSLDLEAVEIPSSDFLDEIVSEDEKQDSTFELDGAIWFVSLLTRVDGLVLLSSDLTVRGFGVEINVPDVPPQIFRARDVHATVARLERVDYEALGTRHRSMMRYCAKVPGSLGLVVSQDGGVRVMTSNRGRLVVWESIQLQLDVD
jgi:hypothetical protein